MEKVELPSLGAFGVTSAAGAIRFPASLVVVVFAMLFCVRACDHRSFRL